MRIVARDTKGSLQQGEGLEKRRVRGQRGKLSG